MVDDDAGHGQSAQPVDTKVARAVHGGRSGRHPASHAIAMPPALSPDVPIAREYGRHLPRSTPTVHFQMLERAILTRFPGRTVEPLESAEPFDDRVRESAAPTILSGIGDSPFSFVTCRRRNHDTSKQRSGRFPLYRQSRWLVAAWLITDTRRSGSAASSGHEDTKSRNGHSVVAGFVKIHSAVGRSVSQSMKSAIGGTPPCRRNNFAHCARWPCECRHT